MKKTLIIVILFLQLLYAQETFENYVPQKFFNATEMDTFFRAQTGELLKKIMVNGND